MTAIKLAISERHHRICEKAISLYGSGHAAQRITDKTIEVVLNGNIDLKKKFYDSRLENT